VLFVKGLSRPSGPSGIWLVILPVVVIVGILAFYFAYMVASGHLRALNYVRQFTRDQAPSIRAALESGCATVLKVSSNQCVVIEEFEDEGSAYIYDLGDGNSLYLQGQEYCPTPDDAPWPARQFEIVRAARDGRLVGIFCSHEPVEHVRTVLANEMPQDSWLTDEPKTESVLRGQPDEVLKTLRNRPQ
jgi:hypothetical protein